MADPIHRAKLCQGAAAWNAWRERQASLVPDLEDLDLSLTERQLSPLHGQPVDLQGARLASANLRHAALIGANLEGAILTGADLMNARLEKANLTRADLTDAALDNADLDGATFAGTIVRGTRLGQARNIVQSQITSCHGDEATELPSHLARPESWRLDGETGGSTVDLPPDASSQPPPAEQTSYGRSGHAPGMQLQVDPQADTWPAGDPLEEDSLPAVAETAAFPVLPDDVAEIARPLALDASEEFPAEPNPISRGTMRSPRTRLVGPRGYVIAGSLAAGVALIAIVSWSKPPSTPRASAATPGEIETSVIAPRLERGPAPATADPPRPARIAAAPPAADGNVLESDRSLAGPAEALPDVSQVILAVPPTLAARPAGRLEPIATIAVNARRPAGLPDGAAAIVPPAPRLVAETGPPAPSLAWRPGTPKSLGGPIEPPVLAALTETAVIAPLEPEQIGTFEAPEESPDSPKEERATPSAGTGQKPPSTELKPATASTDTSTTPGAPAIRRPTSRGARSRPRGTQAAPVNASAYSNPASNLLEQANDQFNPSPADLAADPEPSTGPRKPKAKRSKRTPASNAATEEAFTSAIP